MSKLSTSLEIFTDQTFNWTEEYLEEVGPYNVTHTWILRNDVFFTNTVELKEEERIVSGLTNDTNVTTNQFATTGTINYSQWKLYQKNLIEEIE